MTLSQIFSKNLRTARIHRTYSQQRLSELSGLSRERIADIERGYRPDLRLGTIETLAKALRYDPLDMLRKDFDPEFLSVVDQAKRNLRTVVDARKVRVAKRRKPYSASRGSKK